MTPIIFAAALSLLAADAGQASSEAAPVAETAEHKLNREDPVVCRQEQITGSHFNRRICLRKSSWEEWNRRTDRWLSTLGAAAGVQSQNQAQLRDTQGGAKAN